MAACPSLRRIFPSIASGLSSGSTCATITLLQLRRPDEPVSQGWYWIPHRGQAYWPPPACRLLAQSQFRPTKAQSGMRQM
eukprot:745451-Alexandrium_andersonii.AAC.1